MCGVCENGAKCNSKECWFDGGDCYQFCFTKTRCTHDQFLNDECDEECNNLECNWDAQRCRNETISTIPPKPKGTKAVVTTLPTSTDPFPPPDGTKPDGTKPPPPDGGGQPGGAKGP